LAHAATLLNSFHIASFKISHSINILSMSVGKLAILEFKELIPS
jgi:hypothetical protein